MPGANAATRKKGALTLAANIASKDATSNVSVGPHDGESGVVDQDVDVANFLGETSDACVVVEVRRDEVGAAALQVDLFDRMHPAHRVAAMHGDVGTIPRELKGDRAAEAGRGSRDEGFQAMEIALLSGGHIRSLRRLQPTRRRSTASCAIPLVLSVVA